MRNKYAFIKYVETIKGTNNVEELAVSKRALRSIYQQWLETFGDGCYKYFIRGDGVTEKFVIRNTELKDVDVDEFKKPYYDNGYDCSGQLFTVFVKSFQNGPDVIIYNIMARDI